MNDVRDLTTSEKPTAGHAHDTSTTPILDPAFALDILRRRFPKICLWFGASTRHWWAYADGHLIEARTAQELGQCLDLALTVRRAPLSRRL